MSVIIITDYDTVQHSHSQ